MIKIGYQWITISLFFALVALLWVGCSKDNPVNILPSEVAGTYDFIRYEFVPSAAAIQPANVLDTLVVQNTFLRLTEGGQFLLNYQFINGPESIISGNFSITANRVELQPAAGSEARLTSLLLQPPLRLDRIPAQGQFRDSLEMAKEQVVDLSNFSNRYDGIPPVPGVLFLQLSPKN
ncbi:MAG: hypothetical protein LAT67_14795 [Balneolales bacterium]|nr:hypothetical protein [Balneolales bacterium]